MHPVLFHLGSFTVGTYGLLVAAGFLLALALARRHARQEGLDGEAVTELCLTVLLAGVIGSKLLQAVVDVVNGTPWSGIFSLETLRAGGAVHGGLLLGGLVFLWKARRLRLPRLRTLDLLVAPLALGQAIGRLGCFSSGDSYGTPSSLPWAVVFRDPQAQLMSGTPLGVPLHPVQLYMSGFHFAILLALLGCRRLRRAPGQLAALFLVLEGATRFLAETWRGDLDRGFWLGLSWLSTGRLTGLGLVGAGLVLGFLVSRPDAGPALQRSQR
jgi:phosphatidylglycerol:prolipoprotein diacylglycerol transferase